PCARRPLDTAHERQQGRGDDPTGVRVDPRRLEVEGAEVRGPPGRLLVPAGGAARDGDDRGDEPAVDLAVDYGAGAHALRRAGDLLRRLHTDGLTGERGQETRGGSLEAPLAAELCDAGGVRSTSGGRDEVADREVREPFHDPF